MVALSTKARLISASRTPSPSRTVRAAWRRAERSIGTRSCGLAMVTLIMSVFSRGLRGCIFQRRWMADNRSFGYKDLPTIYGLFSVLSFHVDDSMCGIIGYLDKKAGPKAPIGRVLLNMLQALGCRGPDSAGVALFGPPEEWHLRVSTL